MKRNGLKIALLGVVAPVILLLVLGCAGRGLTMGFAPPLPESVKEQVAVEQPQKVEEAAPVVVPPVPSTPAPKAISSVTTRWDETFIKWARTYFALAVQWQWFKAQSRAESGLNPTAKSPVGAFGMMQLMPFTSAECAKALGIPNMPANPEINIQMGIYYDRKMWGIWQAEVGNERLRFTWASYNAGAGNILKAQKKAVERGLCSNRWDCIKQALPSVTGHHSNETFGYVERIEKYFSQLMM